MLFFALIIGISTFRGVFLIMKGGVIFAPCDSGGDVVLLLVLLLHFNNYNTGLPVQLTEFLRIFLVRCMLKAVYVMKQIISYKIVIIVMIRVVVILVVMGMAIAGPGCPCHHKTSKETGRSAICILHPDNNSEVRGIVTMHQQHFFSPTYLEFTVIGLNPGQRHGCHIHQFGDLTKGCLTAGAHFNPYNQVHGGSQDVIRHVGDLGNLLADKHGVAEVHMMDHMVSLFGNNSVIGRSIVVHKQEDDLGKGGNQQSLRTGNAGARLACGVIGLAKEFKHFNRHDIN